MSSWEKFTKKYVWDSDKTPFFVPVDKLTRLQARKEIMLYVMFVGTPFAVLGIVSVAGIVRQDSLAYLLAMLYSVSVLAACYYVLTMRHQLAAFYTGTAPLAIFLHFLINGFPPRIHAIEQGLLLVFLLLWLRYAMRIIRMTKRYAEMREGVVKPPSL